MAFREVPAFEVREVLRLWLRGEGLRSVERLAGVDRKTVRRYVAAAEELGLVHDGGEVQLSDEFIGSVVEAVRPHRPDGHGEAWRLRAARHDRIEAWLKTGGRLGVLRRCLQDRDPRQHEDDRRQGQPVGAALEPGVGRVRPVPRVVVDPARVRSPQDQPRAVWVPAHPWSEGCPPVRRAPVVRTVQPMDAR